MLFDQTPESIRKRNPTIRAAAKSAAKLGHAYIGTEHILVGILTLQGEAKDLCNRHGLHFPRAYEEVQNQIGRGSRLFLFKPSLRTPRAEKVCAAAEQFASSGGSREVRAIDFLCAICEAESGVAHVVISACEVDLDALRQDLENLTKQRLVESSRTRDKPAQGTGRNLTLNAHMIASGCLHFAPAPIEPALVHTSPSGVFG